MLSIHFSVLSIKDFSILSRCSPSKSQETPKLASNKLFPGFAFKNTFKGFSLPKT